MLNKHQILKRFQTEELKIECAKIIDNIHAAKAQKTSIFSSFLNSAAVSAIYEALKDTDGIEIEIFGGFSEAERKIIGVSGALIGKFPISIIEISFSKKFSKSLTHRDFLGALLSLMIDRRHIGDIIVREGKAFVFVTESMSGVIEIGLEKVGNCGVKCEICQEFPEDIYSSFQTVSRTSVSSLRVDTVSSEVFNLSRGKISDLIRSGKIFINWVEVTENAKTLKEGDTVTLRGTGRYKILSILGETKKGKIALEITKTVT